MAAGAEWRRVELVPPAAPDDEVGEGLARSGAAAVSFVPPQWLPAADFAIEGTRAAHVPDVAVAVEDMYAYACAARSAAAVSCVALQWLPAGGFATD